MSSRSTSLVSDSVTPVSDGGACDRGGDRGSGPGERGRCCCSARRDSCPSMVDNRSSSCALSGARVRFLSSSSIWFVDVCPSHNADTSFPMPWITLRISFSK